MEEFNKTKNPPRITYAKGNYLYENKSSKLIEITCGLYTAGYATEGCSEKLDGKETGFWNQDTWTNSENTVKLPFNLEKVEKFNLENFLVKSANAGDYSYDKAELEKYKPCDLDTNGEKSRFTPKIEQEFISQKYKKKFLVFGALCGIYTMPSNLISVSAGGKLEKVHEGGGGFIQEIDKLSNEDYLIIKDGEHSGACYHTFGFLVFDIAKNKVVFTSLDKGKIDFQTTEEIKW